jgi:transcriptional regulator with XRE-family HTH domain
MQFDTSTFGGRVEYARVMRGWTQEDLASRVPATRGAVSRWESSNRSPRARNLGRLALALGVPAPWLATGAGEPGL